MTDSMSGSHYTTKKQQMKETSLILSHLKYDSSVSGFLQA